MAEVYQCDVCGAMVKGYQHYSIELMGYDADNQPNTSTGLGGYNGFKVHGKYDYCQNCMLDAIKDMSRRKDEAQNDHNCGQAREALERQTREEERPEAVQTTEELPTFSIQGLESAVEPFDHWFERITGGENPLTMPECDYNHLCDQYDEYFALELNDMKMEAAEAFDRLHRASAKAMAELVADMDCYTLQQAADQLDIHISELADLNRELEITPHYVGGEALLTFEELEIVARHMNENCGTQYVIPKVGHTCASHCKRRCK